METRHLVYYRVENGPTQKLEIPMATITRGDAIETILKHETWKSGIVGVEEI